MTKETSAGDAQTIADLAVKAMRVSQVEIEPVLKRAAEACPTVDVRFGLACEDFQEDADGVTVTLRNSSTGQTETVRCD